MIQQRLQLSWLLPLLLACVVFLGGCVKYDVGVNFEGANRGAIAQTIKLGDQLTSFSRSEAQNWLRSIERRAKKLGGKTKRLGDQEIFVTIPFSSSGDLETRFNHFFNPEDTQQQSTQLDFVQLNSEIKVNQNNLIFFQRNRLHLTADLRALGVLTNQGKVIVDPGSLLEIEFRLLTPWGAKHIAQADNSVLAEVRNEGKQLVWRLQPGVVNEIEAVFWLPSSIGMGTIAIALFILLGFFLKYKRFPWTPAPIPPTQTPVPEA
jgi:hypothetical protein